MRRVLITCLFLMLIVLVTACAPIPVPLTDSAPPPTLSGTYVGAFADDLAAIGLATENGKVMVYVCDGLYVSEWFRGDLIGTGFDATSANGVELHVTFDATTASGTVTLPDQEAVPFTAALAEGDAGLYRANENEAGEEYIAGWILLNDGRQVGGINGLGGFQAGFGGQTGFQNVGGFGGQAGGGFGGQTGFQNVGGGGFAGQGAVGGQTGFQNVGGLGGQQTGFQDVGGGGFAGLQTGGTTTTDGSAAATTSDGSTTGGGATTGGETTTTTTETTTTTTGGGAESTGTTTDSGAGTTDAGTTSDAGTTTGGTAAPTTSFTPSFLPAPPFDPKVGRVETLVGSFRPRRANLFLI